ncbi:uncharacterized protein C1683.06c-like isoform X2 [Homalodisca vitripennis]|nr:uncharacterized protein C1683.06c-like isoform X2 [Homalodisca vitripennis]
MVLSLAGVGVGAASNQQTVIIDTDPGIDDAVAIFTALGDPNIKVMAITCARGNADVHQVVVNTLKLLSVSMNTNIPVYTGSNSGLIDSPHSDEYFGKDGLGDVPYSNPPSASNAQKEHAASFLARTVSEYPGEITVICLGPLTNIALAINLNPQFLLQARRVVILGGSIKGQGNAAPGVEFNFYMDPDAASIVLNRASVSGAPVTLLPMETVIENELTQFWRWNVLAKLNNLVVSFMNKMETSQLSRHPSKVYTPYDSYAVAVVLCPGFVTHSQQLYGFVENRSERTRGALVLDYMNLTSSPANIQVVTEVNTTLMKTWMYADLSNFKR